MSEKRLFTLGARLAAAADMVREGTVIADIGTDHAYLPVWLIKNNRIKYAYASDIGAGPLACAGANIDEYGVSDCVETVLSDGLSGISPEKIDDIVICGMGGELISHILQNAQWTKNDKYSFVLQPMSKQEHLRRWLYENGFEIKKERVVSDGKHIYTVMLAVYTGDIRNIDEIEAYVGMIPYSQSKFAAEYLNIQCHRLSKECGGFRAVGDEENVKKTQELIDKISKISEELQ